jgi:predicted transcriptional regulator
MDAATPAEPRPPRRAPRRERTDLYAQVLEVVKKFRGEARVTRISYAVGMPVDRLKRALGRLQELDLLRCEQFGETTLYCLTPRGQQFLDTYWRMRAFVELLERDPEGIRSGVEPPAHGTSQR